MYLHWKKKKTWNEICLIKPVTDQSLLTHKKYKSTRGKKTKGILELSVNWGWKVFCDLRVSDLVLSLLHAVTETIFWHFKIQHRQKAAPIIRSCLQHFLRTTEEKQKQTRTKKKITIRSHSLQEFITWDSLRYERWRERERGVCVGGGGGERGEDSQSDN